MSMKSNEPIELETEAQDLDSSITILDDDLLTSVAGGCTPNCGGGGFITTPFISCA
jgi:hypothetical protein